LYQHVNIWLLTSVYKFHFTSSFWTNSFQHIHLFSGMGIEVQM
jgi:hypothetical protein